MASKKLVISSWAQITATLTKVVANTVASILVARHLGVNEYGKLGYSLALASIFSPLSSFGVREFLQSSYVNGTKFAVVAFPCIILEFIGSFLAALGIICIGLISKDIEVVILCFCAAANMFTCTSEIAEVWLLKKENGVKVAYANLNQLVANFLMSCYGVYQGWNVVAFGFINVAQNCIRACSLAYEFAKNCRFEFNGRISYTVLLYILKKCLPFMGSGLLIMIYMRGDQILLEWLEGSYAVGQYAMATRAQEVIYIIPTIIAQNVQHKVHRNDHGSSARYLYINMVSIGIAMTFISFFALPTIVIGLVGDKFGEAAESIHILSFAVLPICLGCGSYTWLVNKGYTDIVLKRSLVGAISNIVCNLVLIPSLGVKGACISTVTSCWLSITLVDLTDKRSRANALISIQPF